MFDSLDGARYMWNVRDEWCGSGNENTYHTESCDVAMHQLFGTDQIPMSLNVPGRVADEYYCLSRMYVYSDEFQLARSCPREMKVVNFCVWFADWACMHENLFRAFANAIRASGLEIHL
jgi:hypothetical protein